MGRGPPKGYSPPDPPLPHRHLVTLDPTNSTVRQIEACSDAVHRSAAAPAPLTAGPSSSSCAACCWRWLRRTGEPEPAVAAALPPPLCLRIFAGGATSGEMLRRFLAKTWGGCAGGRGRQERTAVCHMRHLRHLVLGCEERHGNLHTPPPPTPCIAHTHTLTPRAGLRARFAGLPMSAATGAATCCMSSSSSDVASSVSITISSSSSSESSSLLAASSSSSAAAAAAALVAVRAVRRRACVVVASAARVVPPRPRLAAAAAGRATGSSPLTASSSSLVVASAAALAAAALCCRRSSLTVWALLQQRQQQ
jgi:hypothetical protein